MPQLRRPRRWIPFGRKTLLDTGPPENAEILSVDEKPHMLLGGQAHGRRHHDLLALMNEVVAASPAQELQVIL